MDTTLIRPAIAAAALALLAACGGGDTSGSTQTVPPAQMEPPAAGNNPCRYSADAVDRWITAGNDLPGCLQRLQNGQ